MIWKLSFSVTLCGFLVVKLEMEAQRAEVGKVSVPSAGLKFVRR